MKHAYIFRLDDACPEMKIQNWDRIESILDRYGIKPIVGVIPDNKDTSFGGEDDGTFWDRVRTWRDKGWTIAQHGLHHRLVPADCRGAFQKVVEKETEFLGRPVEEQKEMIQSGYRIMEEQGCAPSCFFAPAHTFDKNTVDAVARLGLFSFISDGYARRPYRKGGAVFMPCMFDAPHKLFGVQTFISHPNNLTDEAAESFERFFDKHASDFVSADEYIRRDGIIADSQGFYGWAAERAIYLIRRMRNLDRNGI